jgi:hypothetical protein
MLLENDVFVDQSASQSRLDLLCGAVPSIGERYPAYALICTLSPADGGSE